MYLIAVPTVSISVITPDGTLRNQRLKSQLEILVKRFSFLTEFIFHGVDGRSGVFEGFDKINQTTNLTIIGRELTTTEGACLFSHRNAYKKNDSDWLIVIEDDMEIVSLENFATLIGSMKTFWEVTQPTILLFYVGKNGLIPRFRSFALGKVDFYKVLKIPTTTRAYAINILAREVAIQDLDYIGTADWPTWSKKVNFYLTTEKIFIHSGEENSLVATSTNRYRHVWPQFQYSLIHNLQSLTTGREPSLVGGRYWFWRAFTKPLLLWTISRIPLLKLILIRKNG